MPKDADGRPLFIGDAVIHERRNKTDGKVWFVCRGRILRIEGRLLTIRLNEDQGRVRELSALDVRRYLALVRADDRCSGQA